MRRDSSWAEATAARSSAAVRSPRSASSSSARNVVSGVRSSWLASLTSRRSRASPASSRSSISFSVFASVAISSRAWGTGSRSEGWLSLMVAARLRIRSTGRSAAPATS